MNPRVLARLAPIRATVEARLWPSAGKELTGHVSKHDEAARRELDRHLPVVGRDFVRVRYATAAVEHGITAEDLAPATARVVRHTHGVSVRVAKVAQRRDHQVVLWSAPALKREHTIGVVNMKNLDVRGRKRAMTSAQPNQVRVEAKQVFASSLSLTV